MEKYGHDRVAQIITFSTMAQRAVIRDVARVFGLNPSQIDTLSKAMPRDAADLTAVPFLPASYSFNRNWS